MAAARKGTATPLGAVFSPEQTRRAVARVDEAVAGRRAELGPLQGFISANAVLVSLVQRLPDEISHEIMVPFGGGAFFPGCLIHTNELLVRGTNRRGMELEAMKATISDLEAEAKFFEFTATEASVRLLFHVIISLGMYASVQLNKGMVPQGARRPTSTQAARSIDIVR